MVAEKVKEEAQATTARDLEQKNQQMREKTAEEEEEAKHQRKES